MQKGHTVQAKRTFEFSLTAGGERGFILKKKYDFWNYYIGFLAKKYLWQQAASEWYTSIFKERTAWLLM